MIFRALLIFCLLLTGLQVTETISEFHITIVSEEFSVSIFGLTVGCANNGLWLEPRHPIHKLLRQIKIWVAVSPSGALG